MSKFGHEWRWEKTRMMISEVCFILANSKTIPGIPSCGQEDLRNHLYGLLGNATKLFCEAVEDRFGDAERWSPELVDYLYAHPEKCEEVLKVVESEDYRDNYYDGMFGEAGQEDYEKSFHS